jgi:hypothetical protein
MALLHTTRGSKNIKGVTLAGSGRAYDTELAIVGAALSQRTIVFRKVDVAVVQLLLSAPEKFLRTDGEAASSASLSQVFALTLTFLRTVDADAVRSRLADAKMANNFDPQCDIAMKKFSDLITANGEYTSGLTVALVVKTAEGCTLTCENSRGMSGAIEADPGFGRKIIALWLGVPSDGDAADTKKHLLTFRP